MGSLCTVAMTVTGNIENVDAFVTVVDAGIGKAKNLWCDFSKSEEKQRGNQKVVKYIGTVKASMRDALSKEKPSVLSLTAKYNVSVEYFGETFDMEVQEHCRMDKGSVVFEEATPFSFFDISEYETFSDWYEESSEWITPDLIKMLIQEGNKTFSVEDAQIFSDYMTKGVDVSKGEALKKKVVTEMRKKFNATRKAYEGILRVGSYNYIFTNEESVIKDENIVAKKVLTVAAMRHVLKDLYAESED